MSLNRPRVQKTELFCKKGLLGWHHYHQGDGEGHGEVSAYSATLMQTSYLPCCQFYRGPVWSPDGTRCSPQLAPRFWWSCRCCRSAWPPAIVATFNKKRPSVISKHKSQFPALTCSRCSSILSMTAGILSPGSQQCPMWVVKVRMFLYLK